ASRHARTRRSDRRAADVVESRAGGDGTPALPSSRARGQATGQKDEAMTSSTRIRVLSVDDHPLLREGIATMIDKQPDIAMVAQASTGREAIQQYRSHQPDVTLMDLRLPDMSGVDTTIAIRAEFPDARIVMVSTFDGDVEI